MAPKPPRRPSRPRGAVARPGNPRASDRGGAGAGGGGGARRAPAGPGRAPGNDRAPRGGGGAAGGERGGRAGPRVEAVARRAPAEPWRASVPDVLQSLTDVIQIVAGAGAGVKLSLTASRTGARRSVAPAGRRSRPRARWTATTSSKLSAWPALRAIT